MTPKCLLTTFLLAGEDRALDMTVNWLRGSGPFCAPKVLGRTKNCRGPAAILSKTA